jgi:NADP-dependent 3-hydroxy acid dehydrogenase YdfG
MPRAGHQDLHGARVLITGGSSGIGLITAEKLGAVGARTVLLARGEEGLAEAASRVSRCAGGVAADVSHADEVSAAVEQASRLLGGIDAVVAGAGAAAYGPFAEMESEDWCRTVEITLLGVMNTAAAVLPHLEQTGGTLVVVGSVAGRLPVPWLTAYAAAKHGVRGFVRSLDAELRAERRPVSLALIAPGPVDTPFWKRARTSDGRLPPEVRGAYRPEEVADEILHAIARPGSHRLERTVGGLMLPALALEAVVPNLLQVPLGALARLGWRNRGERPPSRADGLAQPTVSARAGGGLRSRPSGLQRLRDLVSSRP